MSLSQNVDAALAIIVMYLSQLYLANKYLYKNKSTFH